MPIIQCLHGFNTKQNIYRVATFSLGSIKFPNFSLIWNIFLKLRKSCTRNKGKSIAYFSSDAIFAGNRTEVPRSLIQLQSRWGGVGSELDFAHKFSVIFLCVVENRAQMTFHDLAVRGHLLFYIVYIEVFSNVLSCCIVTYFYVHFILY